MIRKTTLLIIYSLLIACTIAIIIAIIPLFSKVHHKQDITEINLIIPRGATNKSIINILYDNQLIKYKKIGYLYINLYARYYKKPIRFGEYKLFDDMNMHQILQTLFAGKFVIRKVMIPEGYTLKQIIQTLDEAYGLFGKIESSHYHEGWLMPDTYYYTYGTSKQDILDTMHNNMKHFLFNEWENRIFHPDIKNLEQALVLASIVEKEAALKSEIGPIAALYLKRLSLNMKLQADPTVLYGLERMNIIKRSLTYRDLETPNIYNTYLNYGLPPTPIANPGKDAIRAVLQWEETNNVYFVSNCNKGHNFASHYIDHLKNVRLYRECSKLY